MLGDKDAESEALFDGDAEGLRLTDNEGL